MAVSSSASNGHVPKNSVPSSLKTTFSAAAKPVRPSLKKLHQFSLKFTAKTCLDKLINSTFHFLPQQLLPSQKNFSPVEEIGKATQVICCEGQIPNEFPEGVFIRNGANPLFGGLKKVVSIFGRASNIWVEGEGMLHALYFKKNENGNWILSYKNKYVESETFKMEKKRNKPSFLPAIEGDSSAIIAAYFLNMLRFGTVNKLLNNTNVFEHSGRLYSISENHQPQEIDISSLETMDIWEHKEDWNRPFGSHPKKAPNSGELVIMGVDAVKPYYVVGVWSADGKTLLHKADLNFNRCCLSHDIGVTEKYNIIIDHPLIFDGKRLLKGGPCLNSVVPGPEKGSNKHEWFSRGYNFKKQNEELHREEGNFFSNTYEWRLNMASGKVEERKLISTDFSMDFPFINDRFCGLKHNYGYTQVINSKASSISGMSKYGGLAKLSFTEQNPSMNEISRTSEETVKVEYHMFEENTFCTGSTFVYKNAATEEDDGWIVTYVHNEDSDLSQIYVIDAKKFKDEPVAKISLPQRVPYGFHGAFIRL